MSPSLNLLLFVAAVGILQSFFLACLIYFHPKSDRSVNRFLAHYIFWLCVPMFTPLIQHFFSWQHMILMEPFLLLAGPFLYLYVCSFKETITWRKAWPHFILFVLYAVFDVYLFDTWSNQYPSGKVVPPEVVHDPSSIIRVSIRIIQMITYPFLARNALTSYQRSINQLFSETSRIDLGWVRWLINGFLVLVLLLMSLYLLILQEPEDFKLIILINTAIVTPYIYVVTFKGITQPTLWQLHSNFNKEQAQESLLEAEKFEAQIKPKEIRNEKAFIAPEKLQDIVTRTIGVMEEEKLFLQSELALQDIADRLKIPAYQVSQAINEGLNKTFYDLVNGYRVEEAKRLLLDPKSQHAKILAVAFDSGFNSKTTFNTVFKKFTGLTPTDFKEQKVRVVAEA